MFYYQGFLVYGCNQIKNHSIDISSLILNFKLFFESKTLNYLITY
jgi:hypothetical protein